MANKWRDIRATASPETIAAAARKTEAMRAVLELVARFPDGSTIRLRQFEADEKAEAPKRS